jgi:hypothetical protein
VRSTAGSGELAVVGLSRRLVRIAPANLAAYIEAKRS